MYVCSFSCVPIQKLLSSDFNEHLEIVLSIKVQRIVRTITLKIYHVLNDKSDPQLAVTHLNLIISLQSEGIRRIPTETTIHLYIVMYFIFLNFS